MLDEATSSLDTTSEIEMFKQCRLLNITCITVCHNEALERDHQQRIFLDGLGGWKWSEVQSGDGASRGAASTSGAGIGRSPSEDMEADTLAGGAEDSY